jgi:hypothetical protein
MPKAFQIVLKRLAIFFASFLFVTLAVGHTGISIKQ